jgi:hypothetical protein
MNVKHHAVEKYLYWSEKLELLAYSFHTLIPVFFKAGILSQEKICERDYKRGPSS